MAEGGSDHTEKVGHEEYFDWRCNVCEEAGLMKEGTAYCTNCDETFCDPCLKFHDRFNKRHKVLDSKEKVDWGKAELTQDTGIDCVDHPGQIISIYCKQHDDLCCPVCAVNKHSDRCKPMSYIPVVAKGIKNDDEFKAAVSKTSMLVADFTKLIQEKEDQQFKLTESRKNCTISIEKFHKDLVEHLEKLKNNSIKEMNEKHDKLYQATEVDVKACRKAIQELQEIEKQLHPTAVPNESLLFFNMKSSQKSMSKYSDALQCQQVLEESTFEFRHNSDLESSVTTAVALGNCVKPKAEKPLSGFSAAVDDSKMVQRIISDNKQLTDEFERIEPELDAPAETVTAIKGEKMVQMQFALDKLHRKKSTKISETELIDRCPMSEMMWDILCENEKGTLQDLQTNSLVYFNGDAMILSGSEVTPAWNHMKKAASDLQYYHIGEIVLDEKNIIDAKGHCREICECLHYKCCFYMEKKRCIVLCCKYYEDLKKVKLILQVKQGKIQPLLRRGRHLAAIEGTGIESNSADKGSNQAIRPNRSDRRQFDRNLHAENCKQFTTNEGIIVKVYKANILNLPVDCIVNAANERLQHGGGVARVIADAAGDDLVHEGDKLIREKGNIPVGNAYTTTAGKLPYECVIHAVGPAWYNYQPYTQENIEKCENDLKYAIKNSFYEAEKKGLSSIALPAISSAIFGVPEEICACQYALTTVLYSNESTNAKSPLKEIHFIDINPRFIMMIQDMFERILLNPSRPYNIQKYVKCKSSPRERQIEDLSFSTRSDNGKQKNQEKNFLSETEDASQEKNKFEPIQYTDEKGRPTFGFGLGQQLCLFKGDIFDTRADALVIPVNRYGYGVGNLHAAILNKVTNHKLYNNAVVQTFKTKKDVGEVFVTCGFNHDFSKVFHAVYPTEEATKQPKQRRQSLLTTYDGIFKAAENEGLKSMSVVLLGIAHGSQESTRLSAQMFLKSYQVFCNRMAKSSPTRELSVQLVCREDEKFSLVLTMLNDAVASQQKSDDMPPIRLPLPASGQFPGSYPFPSGCLAIQPKRTW